MGFTGILIIARPELTTSNAGVIAGGLSAIGFAAAAILTRKLTVNNSLTKILFYLTSSQIIFGLLCAGIDNKIQVPAKSNLLPLFVIGVTGLAAHFCMTKSLTLAPASIVMPIDFARLPLIAIIGMLFYNEILDPYVILGASLILAANLINLRQTK